MRAFALALALAATTAHAQIGPPERVVTYGFPIVMQTGSVELGTDITADGISSPVVGFSAVNVGSVGRLTRSIVIDLTGGAAVVACFALPCSGMTERRNGQPTGDDDWVFADGVFLPRFDAALMGNTPVGAIGGGFHFGAAGAGGGAESFGWLELGPSVNYAAQVGPATVVAGAVYAWGYEGDSQAFTGRAATLRADAVLPLGRFNLIGYVSADRHTDTRNTDADTDDLRISTLTFGAGLGF